MHKTDYIKCADTRRVTRLSRLHPYPAMVADELALSLADKYIAANHRVLDPFCGSGRLLAAIENAHARVGVDANPLAWLLTKTKMLAIDVHTIEAILNNIDQARLSKSIKVLDLASDRKVPWFSLKAMADLACIVGFINNLQLDEPELFLLASVLSATTRDVSYARQGGWKLHRIDVAARATFSVSAWDCFKRRLKYCVAELKSSNQGQGDVHVEIADSSNLLTLSNITDRYGPFDIVITSPPYGDSLTTVQYGAASSLSLEAVGHINGLQHLVRAGKIIDGTCLGGGDRPVTIDEDIKPYWAGATKSSYARSVAKFLNDYFLFCQGIADCIKPGGKAILIVGRRSTGGFRLKLDQFTINCLEKHGFRLIFRKERLLCQKRLPSRINRFARSLSEANRASGKVVTMKSEIVLVLEKTC